MSKYWKKEILQQVHEELVEGVMLKTYRDRPKNIIQTLEESAQRFPNKTALVYKDERITYQEFVEQMKNVAYQLNKRYGVKKGDRVALLLMNGIPFSISVFAILKLGAIAVPLNTKLKAQELEYMLSNSEAKIVIANREWWPNLEPILYRTKIEQVFITDVQPPAGTLPYSILLEKRNEDLPQVEITEHDAAFIMYTSGTTGRPKGALISHFNMIHTVMNYKYCYQLNSDDSTVIAVPVFHITGLAAQLMTFVYLGGKIVLMPKFDTRDFLNILEKEKITHVIAAPTVYVMTLQEPDYKTFDVSNLRVIAFGGAPMPGETLKKLKSWIPNVELHNTYGLTETTSPVVIMPDEHQLDHISAVGIPTPVTEFKIVNPDTQEELGPNQVGELLFKGPMVIREYWNNPDATEKAIINGWFSTGDLATVDEAGFITIMDRIKDMINRGGEKIYSGEVEDVLYANPKIMEAAIVGVPDEKYGEVVKACIVPRADQHLTEQEVKDWVQERLAKFKVPTYVEFLDVLPRNPNGKVMKNELKYIPKMNIN